MWLRFWHGITAQIEAFQYSMAYITEDKMEDKVKLPTLRNVTSLFDNNRYKSLKLFGHMKRSNGRLEDIWRQKRRGKPKQMWRDNRNL